MSFLAALALFCTALLVGGMAFFAAIVAPLIFRVLPAETAARFVRALFPPYYIWVLGTASAGAVALFPLSKLDSGLLACVAALAFWLRQVLMPRLNALRDAELAGDPAAGRAFARGHRLSVIANLLQMLVGCLVLTGFAL
jgi:hypothetical protein